MVACCPDYFFHLPGCVALATEVAADKVLEAGMKQFFDQFAGLSIRQVAVQPHDALLYSPGAQGIRFEEFRIIVGFEKEPMGAGQVLFHRFGNVAGIGDHPELGDPSAEDEAKRIDGIVRNRKTRYFEFPERESAVPGNRLPVWWMLELLCDDPPSHAGGIDRCLSVAAAECRKSPDVIGVLVSQEDGVERGGILSQRFEAQGDLPTAHSGIDEDGGSRGTNKTGVA